MSTSEDKSTKDSRAFKLGIYQANVDSAIFMLKSMLIFNAGALVSILVAVSRSNYDGFANAIIGSAVPFFWGLFFAITAMCFFTPSAEFGGEIKTDRVQLAIFILSWMISCCFFIYGTWSTVFALKQLFHAG